MRSFCRCINWILVYMYNESQNISLTGFVHWLSLRNIHITVSVLISKKKYSSSRVPKYNFLYTQPNNVKNMVTSNVLEWLNIHTSLYRQWTKQNNTFASKHVMKFNVNKRILKHIFTGYFCSLIRFMWCHHF